MNKKLTPEEKRERTIEERQNEQKAEIIKFFEKNPVVLAAVKKVGISRSTYYRWRNEDDEFKRNVKDARTEGFAHINDIAEGQLISKVYKGQTSPIFYWLNNKHPGYTKKAIINQETKEFIMRTQMAAMMWYDKIKREEEREKDRRN